MDILSALKGRFEDISDTDINGAKEPNGKMWSQEREWQQVSI